MGLIRKTMSMSTLGVIKWRSRSERAAAAQHAQARAYRKRTRLEARDRAKGLELQQNHINQLHYAVEHHSIPHRFIAGVPAPQPPTRPPHY